MRFYKDPNEQLVYLFDWAALENQTGDSNWLDRTSSPREEIDSATVSNVDSPGLTLDQQAIIKNNSVVAIRIGNGTIGNSYRISCLITTTTGQTVERTLTIKMRNK